MTIKDLLEDLLIEYDELGMEPTTVVPNPSERAIVWKRELTCALRHLRAEVAREIFWEMDKLLLSVIIDDEAEERFVCLDFDKYLALKKKYTKAEPKPPKGD